MTTNEERLIEAIRQMASFSVVDDVMPATLRRITMLANDTIARSDMVGLMMSVRGKAGTPVFTDESAPEIDAAQYETGVGPSLDAFRNGLAYANPSTQRDSRWPAFSAACLERGVHSTLSIPVLSTSTEDTMGALNFYARTEDAFGDDDQTLGIAFAAHAAIVMTNAKAYWDARALSEQLAQALDTRVVIEQAKGILMSTGMTSALAFDRLRRISQKQNRKLHQVAADLVAETERRATEQHDTLSPAS